MVRKSRVTGVVSDVGVVKGRPGPCLRAVSESRRGDRKRDGSSWSVGTVQCYPVPSKVSTPTVYGDIFVVMDFRDIGTWTEEGSPGMKTKVDDPVVGEITGDG